MGKLSAYCISFQNAFVFKSSQPARPVELPATGTQLSQSALLGQTQSRDGELSSSSVD